LLKTVRKALKRLLFTLFLRFFTLFSRRAFPKNGSPRAVNGKRLLAEIKGEKAEKSGKQEFSKVAVSLRLAAQKRTQPS